MWECAGPIGASVLSGLAAALIDGACPPPDLNASLLALLPKGEEEQDTTGQITRDASSLRPLSLKNTDSKLLAGVLSYAMRRPTAAKRPPCSEGLPSGRRDLTQNIVELDSFSRAMALWSSPDDVPHLALHGHRSRFPERESGVPLGSFESDRVAQRVHFTFQGSLQQHDDSVAR